MFRWRKQLCADPYLTDFDFRVAYALAERTLRDTGCARVSQAVLARDVGATQRGVQKSLHRIAVREHLSIEDNSKRGALNRYWPIVRNGVSEADDVEGTNHRSYPPELPFVGGYEPPFVGGTNHGSEGVRTTVRTEDPYEDPETSPERKSPSAADVKSAFEEWWCQYPKRVSKGAARKAYQRIIKSKQATVEQLKLGAMRYAASVTSHDFKFIKHPATWLNGECWADEPDRQPAPTDARPATANAGNGWAGLKRKLG
jgi:hypothetical protein